MTAVVYSEPADDTPLDPYDARISLSATGLLREFNAAGVLSAADVHVARTVGRLGHEGDERVLLAVALAVRAVRLGSVCIVLGEVRDTVALENESGEVIPDLDWPEPADWLEACAASPLVGDGGVSAPPPEQGRPLQLVGGLLYLDRYWRQEQIVRDELDDRATGPALPIDLPALREALARLFPDAPPDRQRLAAAMTVLRQVTVLAGGPGTGKTTTVARLLALLRSQPGDPPRVALAAPTGKAAVRLQEAVVTEAGRFDLDVGVVTASTLHRLLGWRPDSRSRFRHDRRNRLPYDVVVVDESSMVSLTLMSRLLEAIRPDARLVLVGDPDQLASVEAGAVLGDLVARPAAPGQKVPALLGELVGPDLDSDSPAAADLRRGVVRLTRTYRFGHAIGALARAIQDNAGQRVLELLRSGDDDIAFVETSGSTLPTPDGLPSLRDDVVSAAAALMDSAGRGDVGAALAALERHRLLCGHRRGPYGVGRWSAEIEDWLATALEGYPAEVEWYLGRPLVVTANDYELQLFNGDTGVVVEADVDGRGAPMAAFARGSQPVLVTPSRLAAVQTVHAMTVHRAQGSQFDRVSLLLPPAESPLLTRELFYTAVTRAKSHVRVIGSEAAVLQAVSRPIVRASGLRVRAGAR